VRGEAVVPPCWLCQAPAGTHTPDCAMLDPINLSIPPAEGEPGYIGADGALTGEILMALRPVPEIATEQLQLWKDKIAEKTEFCLALLCHAKDIHSVLVTLDDRSFIAVNLIRYVMSVMPPFYILQDPAKEKRAAELHRVWRGWVGGDI
jgi:hypothetical protein